MAETLNTNFPTATLDDAKKLLGSLFTSDQKQAYGTNKLFFDGDHWQGGDGWIGPRPRENEKNADAALKLLQDAFTSKNVIKAVTKRHTSGVIGREPSITFVPVRPDYDPKEGPNDAEKKELEELNQLVTSWWDDKGIHEKIRATTDIVLYGSRAVFRLHVPAGQLDDTSAQADGAATAPTTPTLTVTVQDNAQAFSLIWPDVPDPEQAGVFTDPQTKREIAILIDKVGDKEVAEIAFLVGIPGGIKDVAPVTQFRSISSDNPNDAGVPMQLGGRLPMYEIRRDALITEQVREQQKALNLALSMLPRNVVSSGFLERIFFNAQLPGKLVADSNGEERWVDDPDLPLGAGTSTFLSGKAIEDEVSGKTTLANPSVHIREPSSVTPSTDAIRQHYEDILDEVDQRHILMAGDAVASGISREQARADYEKSLETTQMIVHSLGRWLVETSIAWAEALLNKPGLWSSKYRVEFRTHIDTGPRSSDEIRADNESVTAGNLSRETAMQRAGITDTDAELARIVEQPDAKLARLERISTIVMNFFNAGVDIVAAGTLAGLEPDEISQLTTTNNTPTDRTGGTAGAGGGGNGSTPPQQNNGAPRQNGARQPTGAAAQ